MKVSARSYLTSGVAAIGATAIAIAPSVTPTPVANPALALRRTAAQAPPPPLVDIVAALQQIAPTLSLPAGQPAPTVLLPAPPPGEVVVQNAATDFVNAVYGSVKFWVGYGVDLADYVLGFIPFGYLIGDQINIIYDVLVVPIADSVVFGFIDPVLENPLNLASWVNGAVNVASTSVIALINTGIAEFNYFIGPFIPPIPLPPFPLAATAAAGTPIAAVTPLNAASDTIVAAWTALLPLIDTGVNVVDQVTEFIPGYAATGDQIGIVYANLVRPVANSLIIQLVAPVVDDPLNPASYVDGVTALGAVTQDAIIDLARAEFEYFFGIPAPFAAAATVAPAPQSAAGDAILAAVANLTAALDDANQSFFRVVADVTEVGLFDVAEPVLRGVGLDLVADQVEINYRLLKRASTEEVDGVSELISIPSRYLHDVLEEGQNPLQAIGTEAEFVADRVVTRTGNVVDAVANYAREQIDYFTGNSAAPATGPKTETDEVSSVPVSVQRSLKPVTDKDEPAAKVKKPAADAGKDSTRGARSLADAPRKVAKNLAQAQGEVRGAIADAAASVEKAIKDTKDASGDKPTDTAKTSTAKADGADAKPAKKAKKTDDK
jgi:hypothetical protein